MMSAPTIRIRQDVKGHFGKLVDGWIKEKKDSGKEFNHKTINVSSTSAQHKKVFYNSFDGKLNMTFHRSLVVGDMKLTEQEVETFKSLL